VPPSAAPSKEVKLKFGGKHDFATPRMVQQTLDGFEPAVLGDPDAKPARELDRIAAPTPGQTLSVTLVCSEFTCRCPVTNQPDWATIEIEYEPNYWLVESKSMKLYLETYREEGIFHEYLAQKILDDFTRQIEPVTCRVTANFNTRGGIAISATADYYRPTELHLVTEIGKMVDEEKMTI